MEYRPKSRGGIRPPPPDDVRGRGRSGTGNRTRVVTPGGPPVPVGPTGEPTADFDLFQTQSPYDVRPPDGIDFNIQASGTGLNNATTPVVLPGSATRIPENSVGIIRSLVLTVNNLLLTSVIRWSLRFNGSPVPGWSNLSVTPGPVLYFALSFGPGETYIRVPDGSAIDVVFEVDAADAATYTAGVSYHGWHFNKEMAYAIDRRYR